MKQKKFKIKSSTLFKFKSSNPYKSNRFTDTEPTTTMTSTTSVTVTSMFNK